MSEEQIDFITDELRQVVRVALSGPEKTGHYSNIIEQLANQAKLANELEAQNERLKLKVSELEIRNRIADGFTNDK